MIKSDSRYRAISVTLPPEMDQALQEVCRAELRKKSEVVQEALRLYFGARRREGRSWSLVMPTGEEDRRPDYGTFTEEWGGEHDRVYDDLGR